jgi:hypothetical protein
MSSDIAVTSAELLSSKYDKKLEIEDMEQFLNSLDLNEELLPDILVSFGKNP